MNGLIAEALNCDFSDDIDLESIFITTYGNYTIKAEDEGVDGYDVINVNLPDRYDDGFNDGKNSVVIQSINITQNGIYTAPDDGGYSPVIVNVAGKDYRDYVQGVIDNQAGQPNLSKMQDEETSLSSGHTYTLKLTNLKFTKPNNWSWETYHLEVTNEVGEVMFSEDCSTFDSTGGTNFWLPYFDNADDGLRAYYPVVAGSQSTGYSQTWYFVDLP